MINIYQFGRVEDQNCFEDGATNMIYFPVTDSPDFQNAIRDKVEAIIDSMVQIN